MPVFPRLAEIFRRHGFDLMAGLNPGHFAGAPSTVCTWFLKDGASYTEGLGISVQEIYFLECLVDAIKPRNILVIGNSAGWSTIALALMAPFARVVGMDAGFDAHATEGLSFTNQVAAEEGLDMAAIKGVSPQDVAQVARQGGLGPLDLAFIDGWHESQQLPKDFAACRAVGVPGCVYLFHDIVSCAMEAGFADAQALAGLTGRVLMGTSSGMGILYDPSSHPALAAVIEGFSASPAALAIAADQVFRHRHPHLTRWRRSYRKRRDRIRRLLSP